MERPDLPVEAALHERAIFFPEERGRVPAHVVVLLSLALFSFSSSTGASSEKLNLQDAADSFGLHRGLAVDAGTFFLVILSGLVIALPHASAVVSTVVVSIPSGAGSGASAAPGFSPDSVTVVIGVNNTVEWNNNDTTGTGVSHTVYVRSQPAGGGMQNSSNISPGKTYSFTFTVPGTYDYYCSYHAWMTGTVIVKAATSPAPEFPGASLAVILFSVIAAVVLIAPRVRPALSGAPMARVQSPTA